MIFINAPIPPEEEDQKKSSIRVVFKEYIVPIGTLLVAMVPLFAQNNLPWWGVLALVIYVVIVAVFLVSPVVVRGVSHWRVKSLHKKLERNFLPRVVEMFRRVKPMLDPGRGDTLWSVWYNASQTVETQKYILPARPHFDTLSTWHQNLSAMADRAGPEDFTLIAMQTGQWFQRYASFGRDAYTQFDGLVRDSQLAEPRLREIKQSWNHVRDDHNRLVNDWRSLSEEINGAFGQTICQTYFETLRPLE